MTAIVGSTVVWRQKLEDGVCHFVRKVVFALFGGFLSKFFDGIPQGDNGARVFLERDIEGCMDTNVSVPRSLPNMPHYYRISSCSASCRGMDHSLVHKST